LTKGSKRKISDESEEHVFKKSKPEIEKDVTDFWNNLSSVKETNNSLLLPSGTKWIPGATNRLFVRQCYQDVFDLICKKRDQGKTRFIISGNPGIGKTYFLAYLIFQLKKRKCQIILDMKMNNSCFLFSGTKVLEGNIDDFKEILKDPKTWCLVDGKEPKGYAAITVLATSPLKDIYRDFSKLINSDIMWMPVWSDSEIESCRQICFPRLDKPLVDSLFEKWGGIPRFVLERAQDPKAQRELDDAIGIADLDKLLATIGEISHPDDTNHKLVHIHTTQKGEYGDRYVTYASYYVSARILDRFERTAFWKLRTFLSSSQGLSEMGALRGNLWEPFAHTRLERVEHLILDV